MTLATAGVDPAPAEAGSWTLEDFAEIEVTVDGAPVTVALADTPNLRRQGLQGVIDLGRAEGMLFSWGGTAVDSAFTMRNTLIDLDIAFFDREGRVVDLLRMTPCDAEPCPTYRASGPYAYALEVPADEALAIDHSAVLGRIP